MYEVEMYTTDIPLVRDVGDTHTDIGWIHPDRILDYNVLIFVLEGQMQVIEKDREYIIKTGNVMFLKKGLHHWGQPKTLPGTTTFWVHFYDLCNHEAYRQEYSHLLENRVPMLQDYCYKLTLPKLISIKNIPLFTAKTRHIRELFDSVMPLSRLYLNIALMDLLLFIYKQSIECSSKGKADITVDRIIKYIEARSSNCIDSEELSAELKMNYNYLSTVFKMKTGMTISQYHQRTRISNAARLLRDTNNNISEISHMVGYDDPLYFSRVFKKVMGESPTEYARSLYK